MKFLKKILNETFNKNIFLSSNKIINQNRPLQRVADGLDWGSLFGDDNNNSDIPTSINITDDNTNTNTNINTNTNMNIDIDTNNDQKKKLPVRKKRIPQSHHNTQPNENISNDSKQEENLIPDLSFLSSSPAPMSSSPSSSPSTNNNTTNDNLNWNEIFNEKEENQVPVSLLTSLPTTSSNSNDNDNDINKEKPTQTPVKRKIIKRIPKRTPVNENSTTNEQSTVKQDAPIIKEQLIKEQPIEQKPIEKKPIEQKPIEQNNIIEMKKIDSSSDAIPTLNLNELIEKQTPFLKKKPVRKRPVENNFIKNEPVKNDLIKDDLIKNDPIENNTLIKDDEEPTVKEETTTTFPSSNGKSKKNLFKRKNIIDSIGQNATQNLEADVTNLQEEFNLSDETIKNADETNLLNTEKTKTVNELEKSKNDLSIDEKNLLKLLKCNQIDEFKQLTTQEEINTFIKNKVKNPNILEQPALKSIKDISQATDMIFNAAFNNTGVSASSSLNNNLKHVLNKFTIEVYNDLFDVETFKKNGLFSYSMMNDPDPFLTTIKNFIANHTTGEWKNSFIYKGNKNYLLTSLLQKCTANFCMAKKENLLHYNPNKTLEQIGTETLITLAEKRVNQNKSALLQDANLDIKQKQREAVERLDGHIKKFAKYIQNFGTWIQRLLQPDANEYGYKLQTWDRLILNPNVQYQIEKHPNELSNLNQATNLVPEGYKSDIYRQCVVKLLQKVRQFQYEDLKKLRDMRDVIATIELTDEVYTTLADDSYDINVYSITQTLN